MNIQFRESFTKDLRSIKDLSLLGRVKRTIEVVEQARSLEDIANLKRLKNGGNYYRIRLGDFRIGLIIDGDTVTFVRFLHRKDVYRYFP